MRLRHALGRTDCDHAMAAAIGHAMERDWHVTIAIVDDAGHPLQVVRLDEASPASVEGAIEKARSAAMIGLETALLEAMIASRPALVTLRRLAVEGGVPLIFANQRVGGIGASGVLSPQDAEVAMAGRDVLAALWG